VQLAEIRFEGLVGLIPPLSYSLPLQTGPVFSCAPLVYVEYAPRRNTRRAPDRAARRATAPPRPRGAGGPAPAPIP